jgi:integrase
MPSAAEALEKYRIQFVEFKKAGGVDYTRGATHLKRFLEASANYLTDSCEIPKEAVLAWSVCRDNEKPNTRLHRVNVVRAFTEYLSARGVPAYIGRRCSHEESSNFVPYIFTTAELARLFQAIDNRPNKVRCLNSWYIMPVLFRTLYACGLRVSEAANLRICDVDLDVGILTILETKFHKDRLVPVNNEFLHQLKEYSIENLKSKDKNSPFFPTSTGNFYNVHSIYGAFRKFLWDAGISHGGRGRGPRVHDIRHTFAVHCLRKWVLAGDDLDAAVPYLAAYMGHTHLRHTQVYLRLTPDMYPDVVDKIENFIDVLPDWEGCNETH